MTSHDYFTEVFHSLAVELGYEPSDQQVRDRMDDLADEVYEYAKKQGWTD